MFLCLSILLEDERRFHRLRLLLPKLRREDRFSRSSHDPAMLDLHWDEDSKYTDLFGRIQHTDETSIQKKLELATVVLKESKCYHNSRTISTTRPVFVASVRTMRRHCGKDGRENKKRLRHGLSVLRICGSERIVVRRKHFRKPFYAEKVTVH